MGYAVYIKNIPQTVDYVQQRLYRLSEPIAGRYLDSNTWEYAECGSYDYVVVSASVVPYSGPECFIFGSDAEGNVLDWNDLRGSQRGTLEFENTLMRAGYIVVYETEEIVK